MTPNIKRLASITILIFSFVSIVAEENSRYELRDKEINQSIEINPLPMASAILGGMGVGLIYELSYLRVSFRLLNGMAFMPNQKYYSEGQLFLGMSHFEFRWFPFQEAPIGFYIGGGAGISGLYFNGEISGTKSTSTGLFPVTLGTVGYRFQLAKKGSVRMVLDFGAEAIFIFPGAIEFAGNSNFQGVTDSTYFLLLPSISLGVYF